jgi:S-DNA-T family DNA segregation ATPase FtsK/SpoIIIE
MALWDMLSGKRSAESAEGAAPLARVAAGPEGEAVFLPRGGRSLPPNTRAPTVLGAQPQTFARGREVAALLLWTLAVFFALALASYAGETTGATSGDAEPITGPNWVGPVGASIARAAVSLVGLMSWVVPLEAVLLGIPFVTGRKSRATPARLAGDVLLVVIGASLIQVGWAGKVAFGHHPSGGMVGELFGEIARSLFSTAGSFLVGFALVGLILISRASFSFIALMRALARFAKLAWARTQDAMQSVAEAWEKALALELARREERRLEAEPVIAVPGEDEAMILAGDPHSDSGVHELSPSPSSMPPVTSIAADPNVTSLTPVSRRRAPVEAFEEPSPIIVAEAPVAKKSRASSSPPVSAETRKPRRKKEPKPDVSVEEAIEETTRAADEDELEAEAADAEDEASIAADEVEVAPATKKPSRSSKKADAFSTITIVDTSAALEKDSPAEQATKKEKEKVKRGPKETPAFVLPSLDMLVPAPANIGPMFDEAKLRANAETLVKTLADYKVTGKVEEILPGPVVTTFEVSPVAGTKVSKVAALADDLALALAKKVRIVAPIPGKNRIGFELPNERRVPVNLRDLVEDRRFQTLDVPLPVVLGRDIVGNPVYADLASMPHAIVAGATGAGKSVGLNVMLTSLLFRRTPEELRMLMIDPKVVELAPYDRIPHMLLPVVTDMKQAATALKWAVDEMERRYQLFADAGTKNIGTYNAWVKRVLAGEIKNPLGKAIVGKDLNGIQEVLRVREDDPDGEQVMPETLPMIVIVVDEFADLMMQQGKEVETCVARLAQKARAAGMHVILATQRPSVDVITGMIKANFPTRVAFRVAQKIDSRTILDEQGAEHLLGKGDMLIKLNGTNETRRVQCPWVSEEEVQLVTDFLRSQGEPVYDENILKPRDDEAAAEDEDDGETDPMYDDAVRIVAETRRCSTSWLQRKLGLGYNRAARIVETMERRGLVGPANGAKDREVLIDAL